MKLLYTYEEAFLLGINCIGGKAFSVAKLSREELPIPRGVIIPSDNSVFFSQNSIDKEIFDVDLLRLLQSEKYVVRSSAIGEDSSSLSWAGCFDTYLNIGIFEVWNKVKECINSLNNERAFAYQKLHGAQPILHMAVLIQEYIDAEYSGVCFTANPITGNRNEIVYEYQRGKSGLVVSGEGHPKTIIIPRTYEPNHYLPDLLLNIDIIIKRIELLWDCPIDVEWVISKGKVIVTQVRPITTL